MIFSILIVFAILLTVSCGAFVGHLMLSARESRRRLDEARLEQEARETVPEPVPTPPPNGVQGPAVIDAQIVTITAQPSVRFDPNLRNSSAGTDPIMNGTTLVRLARDRWIGASRELSDNEVERLVYGGHAQIHGTVQMSPEAAMNFNVTVQRMVTQANQMTETANESMRRMQQSMPSTQDLNALFENFAAPFTIPGGITNQSKVFPAPKPKPTTPKSAIDRLLEDDLLADDDSGVK